VDLIVDILQDLLFLLHFLCLEHDALLLLLELLDVFDDAVVEILACS
jgi:hypothetical protein